MPTNGNLQSSVSRTKLARASYPALKCWAIFQTSASRTIQTQPLWVNHALTETRTTDN